MLFPDPDRTRTGPGPDPDPDPDPEPASRLTCDAQPGWLASGPPGSTRWS
jgi:hypothetical protein